MKSFTAKKGDKNKRLDVFAAEKLTELSRSAIQKLCDAKKITVNGTFEASNKRLHAGDKVKVEFSFKSLSSLPKINLPILYEDDDCLVIDKPTGILIHSKGVFNPEATVASFIKPKLIALEGDRAGIVHRLDRGTSGVIICAKNQAAMSWLQKQFSTRKVKKQYLAIIEGELDPPSAVIDMPIARNPKSPKTFKVSSSGKDATTTYETVEHINNLSLVKLKPKTGRTHQLRVHLAQLGHPIVGDDLYEGATAPRLYLHASSLEITLPSRERCTFTADLPKDFTELMHG